MEMRGGIIRTFRHHLGELADSLVPHSLPLIQNTKVVMADDMGWIGLQDLMGGFDGGMEHAPAIVPEAQLEIRVHLFRIEDGDALHLRNRLLYPLCMV